MRTERIVERKKQTETRKEKKVLILISLCVVALLCLASQVSRADPIAYEGFCYYPVGGALSSYTGTGFGWQGDWSGDWTVAAPGLTYVNGGTLLVSGNRVTGDEATTISIRTLGGSLSLGDPNTTLWVSMIAQQTSGVTSGTWLGLSLPCTGPNAYIFFGKPWSAVNWGTDPAVLADQRVSTVPATTQAFLVMRIDFKDGLDLDDVHMWVNPPLNTAPSKIDADVKAPNYGDFNGITTVRVSVGSTGGLTNINGTVDEVRLGTAFRDVAPLSIVAPPSPSECCESIEFQFGGTVTSLGFEGCDPPWDSVNVGDDWSIVYTFESCTPDTTLSPTRADYYRTITRYALRIGSVIVSDLNPLGIVGTRIAVFDNRPPAWDQYEVDIALPGGMYDWFMQLDGPNTAWATDELPLCGDIVLSNFSIRDFRLSDFGGPGFGCEISGSVNWHECSDLLPPDVKWQQCPDETPTGMDIRIDHYSDVFPAIADDFECTQPGLITDVHFWGSWKGDVKGDITKIHLSIHKDIPADSNDPSDGFSKPGDLLWEMDFYPGDDFTETLYADLSPEHEWWWYPGTGELDACGDSQIWRYDIDIDPDVAFVQEGMSDDPEVYWLAIYVETDLAGQYQFGWKTSKKHWNDDAVYWAVPGGGLSPPFELRYPAGHPYAGRSIDMAFMITTEPIVPPQACCFPDGSCQELTPAECKEEGGWPGGDGTTCATTECPDPNEACCLPDGSCEDLTLAECQALGGTPQGSDTDCSDVKCPLPCDIGEPDCPDGQDPVVITYWAGSNDNFAPLPEPALPDKILKDYIDCNPHKNKPLQFDEVPGEDDVPAHSWFGHTFACLPPGIVAAKLEIRARATTGGGKKGTDNDRIRIVNSIKGCAPKGWRSKLKDLPEANGTWDPNQVATFCLDLDALPTDTGPISVLGQLASGSLSILIEDDTGLDYMKLTIAVCPCEYPYLVEIMAGVDDGCEFTLPTEPAFPRSELESAWGSVPWRSFDQIVGNIRFGHTFTDLRCCPIAAELVICMRAGWGYSINDTLSLQFLAQSSSFAWGHNIGTHLSKDGLPLNPDETPISAWTNRKETFTLNLDKLPPSNAGVTSVLGNMGADGYLDVYIQDDTAVDHMILRYWCCCEETVPGDINNDGINNFEDLAIFAEHWLECRPPFCP
jgi:hypothetical protein